ncbi:hypothetical protein K7X08_003184 [Anisodus acutangulus]|uniref:TsaA-like domain-containing protein n=1 Tax=Anisodus acutangulus TaxID=402998 RepID=A0A9Q1MGY6_9SOLA|nr:hypothetical protein K7X08_003184 [Anisodus acutangulus]
MLLPRNGTPRQPLIVPLARACLVFDPTRVPPASLEGLTVSKVDVVDGNKVFISGVDVVDGTPVLDIKTYLPYCDSIPGAMVPDWVSADNMLAVTSVNFSHDFSSSLNHCWSRKMEKTKKERIQPHKTENSSMNNVTLEDDDSEEELHFPDDIVYHLILEGLNISYKIDLDGNVHVEKVDPCIPN